MNILIVGYGRMGKMIESILLERKHNIVARIDSMEGVGDFTKITPELLSKSDAVIEFSLPEGILENCRMYCENKTPAIIGTTGWFDKLDEVNSMVQKNNSCLLYGSNFSIGAHIFFKLAETGARLINSAPEYDIMTYELHHKMKKDSPSGTALTLAKKIIDANNKKTTILTDTINRQIKDEELHVSSVRGGSINGIHTVLLDSMADTIEITHTARNRSGFALGAVMAAEWVKDKKGLFQVEDFIEDIFK